MNADDLVEHIVELVKTCVNDMNVELVADNGRKSTRISALEKELYELRHEVNGIPKLLKKAERDGIASMFGGLSVRDKVWVIDHVPTRLDCVTCQGVGIITVYRNDDEFPVQCPACNGHKHTTTYTSVPKERKIGTLSYEISDRVLKNVEFKSLYFSHSDFTTSLDKVYRTEDECLAAIAEAAK